MAFAKTTLFPSPKFHVHLFNDPALVIEASVNVMIFVSHAGAETLKSAAGKEFTVIVFAAKLFTVLHPIAEVTLSLTV